VEHRPALAIAAAASFVVYLTGFALGDAPGASSRVLAATGVALVSGALAAPLFAALRWPRWWLVPATFAVFVAIPLFGNSVLLQTGLEVAEKDCDPCVDASILSILAVPATAFALVGVLAVRWRLRRALA
jgi:hypothetical protein